MNSPKTAQNLHKPFLMILGGWTVLGLLQAALTPLLHDEAYYWVYSQNLDWGHFHQPPGIALLIAIGDAVWHHPLGVRMLPVLGASLVLLGLARLNDWKQPMLFFLLFAATFLAHAGQFLAVPDAALVISAILFLSLLKPYLGRDSWWLALGLGVMSAALLYSKYHGILVIGFAVLANPRLLRRPSFWAAAIIAVLLFLPHVWWQYQHDWAAIRFHWLDRSPEPWSIMRMFEYLGGQVIVLGPLVSLPLLWALVKFKPQDSFERTLVWLAAGILLFFFVMSLRGRVEANWTATALLPLLLIAHRYYRQRPNALRWLKPLAVTSIALLLSARFVLMAGVFPSFSFPVREFAVQEEWAESIAEIARGNPVVFYNRYQNPSIYQFHTGQPATSYNAVGYGGNQYSFDGSDTLFFDKPALIIESWRSKHVPRYELENGDSISAYRMDGYRQYNFLKGALETEISRETDYAEVHISNTWRSIDIPADRPTYLGIWLWAFGENPKNIGKINLAGTSIGREEAFSIPLSLKGLHGTYRLSIGIEPSPLLPLRISQTYRLDLKK